MVWTRVTITINDNLSYLIRLEFLEKKYYLWLFKIDIKSPAALCMCEGMSMYVVASVRMSNVIA